MSFLPPPMLTQRPHIVAHLDFLGAREKMRSPQDSEKFLQQINDIYTKVDSDLSRFVKAIQRTMKVRIFSDNILLAINPEQETNFFVDFIRMARFCTMFQLLALTKGLFVRGAITYGDFIANDVFVFGAALVNAYEAETTRAIYPRTIIDTTVFAQLPEHRRKIVVKNDFLSELLKCDFDGQWYVSPFGITPPHASFIDKTMYLKKAKESIFQEYKNSTKEEHKQKYFWLIQKFNEFCNRSQDYQDLRIPLSECDPNLTEVML